MTSLGAIWEIARREIRERGKSKAYLLTSLLTLLLVIGIIVVPTLIGGGTDEYKVGSLGEGNAAIVEAAERIGNVGLESGEDPRVGIEIVEFEDRETADAALEAGEVDVLLVDAEEMVTEGGTGLFGSSLARLLQRGAATVELERLVAESGEAATEVIDVMTSDPLELSSLSGEDPSDETGTIIAYVGLILLYMAILLYGTWILTGVTEEKTNRVVEVLLSSVRPWQLLAGKILGIGLLGLGQFGLTILIGAVAIKLTGAFDLPELPIGGVINLVVWFVLGFLLYAVLFGAAGSLASRMEDAQTAALPMTALAVIGFFVSIRSLDNPDGLLASIGTFVPLTAPFVVPVRAALGAIEPWEYVLAVLITIGTIVAMVFVAGRVYAGGILQFGGKIKVRDAWRSANG
jgi:ABC-2 type transport system permease protein